MRELDQRALDGAELRPRALRETGIGDIEQVAGDHVERGENRPRSECDGNANLRLESLGPTDLGVTVQIDDRFLPRVDVQPARTVLRAARRLPARFGDQRRGEGHAQASSPSLS